MNAVSGVLEGKVGNIFRRAWSQIPKNLVTAVLTIHANRVESF